ncbi:MAG: KOW domain-containing RNA-binding protein [Negativicutes bacterium]|nr:KOW domain-containing RNA-binding protein [Negativicutes bacterium]
MSAARLPVGSIVVSSAGRDKGRAYVIIAEADRPFVLVADGRDRKVANPKKKNIRHLIVQSSIAGSPAGKDRRGSFTDECIRQALHQICPSDQK